MPAKAHLYAQDTEYRSLSSLVWEGNGSCENVEANEGSKLYALVGVCQRKHNWQIDSTTKHGLTGSFELLPDAGCPEMQILNFE